MTIDFSKFDKEIDLNQYKADMNEAGKGNSGDYPEVPVGKYVVAVDKLELGLSKAGKPMGIVWFTILEGEYENSKLFYYKTIDTAVGGAMFRDFLRSLESGLEIKFESFSQFANLVLDVHEAINGKLEYEIQYSKNAKGFTNYKVTAVYEVE